MKTSAAKLAACKAYYWRNRDRQIARMRARYHANPKKAREQHKRWLARPGNRERARAAAREYHRKHRDELLPKMAHISRRLRYGAEAVEHYERQLKKQKKLCAICRKKMKRPQQDHDHSCCRALSQSDRRACGKCNRGLLCSGCNWRLHFVEETLRLGVEVHRKNVWLRQAQGYLRRWER
jgi:hypothetical protein